MKYIVLEVRDNDLSGSEPSIRELPFIFPNNCVHKDIADCMTQMLIEDRPKGCSRVVRVVSAGEISSMTLGGRGACHGNSTTLKVESRGDVDSALIQTYDYLHGIK